MLMFELINAPCAGCVTGIYFVIRVIMVIKTQTNKQKHTLILTLKAVFNCLIYAASASVSLTAF